MGTNLATLIPQSANLVCQACKRENAPDAVRCIHCGVIWGETNILVPDKPTEGVAHTNKISHVTRQDQGSLLLLIAAQDQSLVFKGKDDIIIGRHTEGETPPTLDLNAYGGHQLGVSRRHAVIHVTDGRYTLEDLGSANGTFVNERRLPPYQPYGLRNGDMLRLGQLMIFTSFNQGTSCR